MKGISQRGSKVLYHLLHQALTNGGSIAINQNETFMPVHVDVKWQNEKFIAFSVGHYYEQNGDLMADPEITYLAAKWTLNRVGDVKPYEAMWFAPFEYRMDAFGTFNQMLKLDDELSKIVSWKPSLYSDNARFTTQWMDNIKYQQGLKPVNAGKVGLPQVAA